MKNTAIYWTLLTLAGMVQLLWSGESGYISALTEKLQSSKLNPTVVIKIVDPDNGPGTDYTSLNDFSTGEKRNLVALNQIAVALCRSSAGSPDVTAATIEHPGWTTDENHFVMIVADSGHRAGPVWDETKYRLEIDDSNHQFREAIDAEGVHLRLDGIQIGFKGTGSSNRVFDFDENCPLTVVENCYFKIELVGSGSITVLPVLRKYIVRNCVFEGINFYPDNGRVMSVGGNGDLIAINNTIYGFKYGFYTDSGKITAINNIVRKVTDGFKAKENGTFTSDSDFNSSSISGDAPVQSPRNNTQSPWYSGNYSDEDLFRDIQNRDFHLKENSIFQASGIGPAANSHVPGYDIELEGRTGNTTDMGADQIYGVPLKLDEPVRNLPGKMGLIRNYPNPFNPSTKLEIVLPDNSRVVRVAVNIFDITGRLIRHLYNGYAHDVLSVEWDGKNDAGQPLSSGVYLAAAQGESFRLLHKMYLLR